MEPRTIPKGVPAETLDHFSTNSLASPTLKDPAFEIHPMSRAITHNGRGHTLTGGTWNTADTIAHLLSFYRPSPSPTDPTGSEQHRAEVRRFYTFGGGLNAHPDLLHGGVIATILDSTMGNVIGFAVPEARRSGMFTVQLNVTYEKPVRTPGTVMVRAWVKTIQDGGRKVWVEGVVEGEGVRHARAEGMWLRAKGKDNKL
ncbi:hypothetical protein NA57DRAFT_73629 [Rhizodiscina lignyota]|uniref:Thioesterase domain-containing protein n=1 Tax=Rhizodiscina lignyota TaxID=1504668 RepID=A0A9P4IPK3_9PEZI|nr:hypothetical protein NA57DRAFT_73629 [Rhizodiscina lignyota]